MSVSLHEASVPVFARALSILSTLLDKAEAHAKAEGVSPDDMIQARLAPDMLTLAGQVQRASDSAKSCAARLAGQPIPSYPDDETTFAALRERIAKTEAFIRSVDPTAYGEHGIITIDLPKQSLKFQPSGFLFTFALPNFFFHLTTAYDILRHKGLKIGKLDYLGPMEAVAR